MRNRALQLLGPDQPLTMEADTWIHIQARDKAVAKLEAEDRNMRQKASRDWVEVEVKSDNEED